MRSTELKVGIFFALGLVLLIVLFEMVGRETLFTRMVTFKTYFPSIGALRVGDPVTLAGVEVGTVSDIRIVGSRVEVLLRVRKGAPVKTDAVAAIKLTSLLGGAYVDLTFGSPDRPLAPPGAELASTEPPDINTLLAQANEVAGQVKVLVRNIGEGMEQGLGSMGNMLASMDRVIKGVERGEGTFGKLLRDDTLYTELREASTHLNRITRQIDSGEGTFGKLLRDDTLYTELREASTHLNRITRQIDSGEGTFGKLLRDDALYTELKGTSTNLNRITRQIDSGEGTFGKLLRDDSLYTEMKSTLSNLGAMSRKITDAQGTLGKLVNDDSLYVEMKGTMTSLNSVMRKIDRGEGTLGKLLNDDSLYFTAKDSLKKVGKGADQLREQGPLTVIGLGLGALF